MRFVGDFYLKKVRQKFGNSKKGPHLCARFSQDGLLSTGRKAAKKRFFKICKVFFAGLKKVFTFATRFGKGVVNGIFFSGGSSLKDWKNKVQASTDFNTIKIKRASVGFFETIE